MRARRRITEEENELLFHLPLDANGAIYDLVSGNAITGTGMNWNGSRQSYDFNSGADTNTNRPRILLPFLDKYIAAGSPFRRTFTITFDVLPTVASEFVIGTMMDAQQNYNTRVLSTNLYNAWADLVKAYGFTLNVWTNMTFVFEKSTNKKIVIAITNGVKYVGFSEPIGITSYFQNNYFPLIARSVTGGNRILNFKNIKFFDGVVLPNL